MGDCLLLVATDRISAFDCVMPNGVPDKGAVLTQLSHHWFDLTARLIPNHRLFTGSAVWPTRFNTIDPSLRRRSMVVRKAEPLPVECVVRGYLAGSGWKEYCAHGSVCGEPLKAGLKEAAELPEPIFTPATKANSGHDENISFAVMAALVGSEAARQARDWSLQLYRFAREHARQRGILIADTKFEFGWANGQLILIDEVLTPDSSRFWAADGWAPGSNPPSFDKQFVRDYLERCPWDKRPPAPSLPPAVVAKTREKYVEAFERLTGRKWVTD